MAKLIVTALTVSPSLLRVGVLPGDNVYVAGGVQLNLSPGNILDPKQLGVIGPSQALPLLPGVFSESMGGYGAQVVQTSGGLANYKLQYFQPNGTELGAGAYPGAITGGILELEIPYSS
jgi:hypothetical protein